MNTDTLREIWDFARVHVICSVRNTEDREDLIQDILVRYLEIVKSHDCDSRDGLVKLAKTAARNVVIDFFRKNVRRAKFTPQDFERERVSVIDLDKMGAEFLLEEIKAALNERELFVVELLGMGLDRKEVCEVGGISKSSFHRVLNNVKIKAAYGQPTKGSTPEDGLASSESPARPVL